MCAKLLRNSPKIWYNAYTITTGKGDEYEIYYRWQEH